MARKLLRPGRPLLGEARRTKIVQTAVTPAERKQIELCAREEGLSVSQWSHDVLIAQLRRRLQSRSS